jgi:hypothetical protein
MTNFETRIVINASKSKVWNVLMDHAAYGNWNPFITELKGNANEGESIRIVLEADGQKPMTIKPTVLVNNSEKEFRWLGHLFVKGLFDGEHYFQLKEVEPNITELIHGEIFTGLLVKPILKMVGESTLKGFNAMNTALKLEAEK